MTSLKLLDSIDISYGLLFSKFLLLLLLWVLLLYILGLFYLENSLSVAMWSSIFFSSHEEPREIEIGDDFYSYRLY